MMRILKTTTLLAVIILTLTATAQEGMPEPEAFMPQKEPEPQGMTFPDFIAEIAEKDQISAEDYYKMADGTMQVAMAFMQQGQKMPEEPIRDALDAVVAGRDLDPIAANWEQIENRLLDLLNPPAQDQNQQQQGDNSEQQDGEQEQDGQQQDSGAGSSEEGGESSEESDSQNQEGQQEEGEDGQQQEGQGENGEQEGEENQSQENSENSEGGEGNEAQTTQSKDGAQMGELDEEQENQEVKLDGSPEQQPQQSQEQMQTLGGQSGAGEPVDAERAALRQMLEQLKQQDEPGKLYQILQEAQSGGRQKTLPNTKDW